MARDKAKEPEQKIVGDCCFTTVRSGSHRLDFCRGADGFIRVKVIKEYPSTADGHPGPSALLKHNFQMDKDEFRSMVREMDPELFTGKAIKGE